MNLAVGSLVLAAALSACGADGTALHADEETDGDGAPAGLPFEAQLLESRSELPACTRANEAHVYYVQTEQQYYYCDGRRLRTLALGADTEAPVLVQIARGAACATGYRVLVGNDLDGDGELQQGEVTGTDDICFPGSHPGGRFTSNEQLEALRGVGIVTGTLELQGAVTDLSALEDVAQIEGDLRIECTRELSSRPSRAWLASRI